MAQAPDDIAGKLLTQNFQRSQPPLSALTDPIADTPMWVTLDQLRAYEHDPRIARNSRYDELRASILARGLDHPPPITRRPGEAHFVIRNGGNTRLAILRELWTETRDEKFFRLCCLFRPWSARGEVDTLVGHLIENEMRGELLFIERAVAVERAWQLYQAECRTELTQAQLAQRLSADGYPVTQPHISRMHETVQHLLPALPTALYDGMGKPQIERLLALRRETCRSYEHRAETRNDVPAFATVFHDVLTQHDGPATQFDLTIVREALLAQLARIFGDEREDPALKSPGKSSDAVTAFHVERESAPKPRVPLPPTVPAIPTTAIQTNAQTGPVRSIPIQVAGLHPITDLWHIDAALDSPDRLRTHIAQFATEIAHEHQAAERIHAEDGGIGFSCAAAGPLAQPPALAILRALSSSSRTQLAAPGDGANLERSLGVLLQVPASNANTPSHRIALSDAAVVKLFRLVRLARRLADLHARGG